jgi:hypothetical protein
MLKAESYDYTIAFLSELESGMGFFVGDNPHAPVFSFPNH